MHYRICLWQKQAQGLGLTHMSDVRKEYMLTHYELKMPDRKPSCPQRVLYR